MHEQVKAKQASGGGGVAAGGAAWLSNFGKNFEFGGAQQ